MKIYCDLIWKTVSVDSRPIEVNGTTYKKQFKNLYGYFDLKNEVLWEDLVVKRKELVQVRMLKYQNTLPPFMTYI